MLNIQPNSTVVTTAEKDGILYLGGGFTKMNGYMRTRVAAFNTTTGALTSFDPSFDNTVWNICVGDTHIAFAGWFKNVSYKNQQITDCYGIIFYDIANDVFVKPSLTKNQAVTNPVIYKTIYHAASGVFYVIGMFNFSFNSINGISVSGATTCFGFRESDYGLIDIGIRTNYICRTGVIESNILYLGINSSTDFMAYNISNPISITPYDTWRPVFQNSNFSCMAYVDNNIWTHVYGPVLSYKSSPSASSTLIGNFACSNPTNATLQAPATSNMKTTSFDFVGTGTASASISEIWDDASYIYLLGNFWGIGPTGFDTRNVMGGICKISKTTYLPVGDKHNTTYNTVINYLGSYVKWIQAGFSYCKYIDGNDVYIFGNIPLIDGTRRNNAFAPYIINADFSKKQLASSLWI